MLQSTFKEGLRPAWFVADEVYSRDGSFWYWLEQTFQQPYVLTVTKKQPTPINFQTHYAEDLLKKLSEEDWHTLSCGLKRWIWKLLFPRPWSMESILHWSFWRRKHQASARLFHYRKRGQAP